MPQKEINKRKTVKVPPALEAAARNSSDDDLPQLAGLDEVAAFCTEVLGVRVNRRYVLEAVGRNELRSFILAKRLRFSKNDVKAWVLGHRR